MNKTDDDIDAYLRAISTTMSAMKGPVGTSGPVGTIGAAGIIKYLCCLVHPRTRKRIKIRLTEDQMEMFDNFSGPTTEEIDLFKMLYPDQALEIDGVVPVKATTSVDDLTKKILNKNRDTKLRAMRDGLKGSFV